MQTALDKYLVLYKMILINYLDSFGSIYFIASPLLWASSDGESEMSPADKSHFVVSPARKSLNYIV